MKLRCYCCGTALADRFAIVTNGSGEVDRAFFATVAHSKNMQEVTIQVVTREKRVEPKNGKRKRSR